VAAISAVGPRPVPAAAAAHPRPRPGRAAAAVVEEEEEEATPRRGPRWRMPSRGRSRSCGMSSPRRTPACGSRSWMDTLRLPPLRPPCPLCPRLPAVPASLQIGCWLLTCQCHRAGDELWSGASGVSTLPLPRAAAAVRRFSSWRNARARTSCFVSVQAPSQGRRDRRRHLASWSFASVVVAPRAFECAWRCPRAARSDAPSTPRSAQARWMSRLRRPSP